MKNNLKYIPLFAWGHFGRGLGLLLLNNKNMREKNTDMGNGVCFMNEPFLVFFLYLKEPVPYYLISFFVCMCVCQRGRRGMWAGVIPSLPSLLPRHSRAWSHLDASPENLFTPQSPLYTLNFMALLSRLFQITFG